MKRSFKSLRAQMMVTALFFISICPIKIYSRDQSAPPKILMMIGEGFNGNEFWEPYFAFTSAGYTVDVAGPETGIIKCGNKSDGSLDWNCTFTLDEVNVSDYVGFFLPGGKGPENLEKYPVAIQLCKEIFAVDLPTATLCHGPRLLAQAGVMKNKVNTYLFRVRDEIPELFESGEMGYYLDRPLVTDGNYLTGRFPADVQGLTEKMMEVLSEKGGLKIPDIYPSILLIDGGISKLEKYAFAMGGLKSQADVKVVSVSKLNDFQQTFNPIQYDFLIILDGKNSPEFKSDPSLNEIIQHFSAEKRIASTSIVSKKYKKSIHLLEGNVEENLKKLVNLAYQHATRTCSAEKEEYNAILAIEEDYDELAYLGMKIWLEMSGYTMITASSVKGNIRSMNGIFTTSTHTYDEIMVNPEKILVFDPGGLWPDHGDYTDGEKAHYNWLIKMFQNNATIISIGFGSYHLCTREEFKDMPVASSDQVMWSFNNKPGGKYVDEVAVLTAPNLITVKSSQFLSEGIKILVRE